MCFSPSTPLKNRPHSEELWWIARNLWSLHCNVNYGKLIENQDQIASWPTDQQRLMICSHWLGFMSIWVKSIILCVYFIFRSADTRMHICQIFMQSARFIDFFVWVSPYRQLKLIDQSAWNVIFGLNGCSHICRSTTLGHGVLSSWWISVTYSDLVTTGLSFVVKHGNVLRHILCTPTSIHVAAVVGSVSHCLSCCCRCVFCCILLLLLPDFINIEKLLCFFSL